MDTKDSSINREMGLQLKREYSVSPYSVRQLSERTGISESVINRMWSKDPRDINITQITWIAALVGVTPQKLVERAVEEAGGLGAIMRELEDAIEAEAATREKSEAAGTNDDLTTRRLQKEAEEMSAAEIEEIAIAATNDPERRSPEPEAP